jgi:hypothetical protein
MRRSGADSEDFGVGRGVMMLKRTVGTTANNDPVLDDNRANGHFALRGGCLRQFERFVHHFAGFGQRHVILLA